MEAPAAAAYLLLCSVAWLLLINYIQQMLQPVAEHPPLTGKAHAADFGHIFLRDTSNSDSQTALVGVGHTSQL